MNHIILEDGYNTDYIYSLVLSLYGYSSDTINEIINIDIDDSNTYYIQEYIKNKFILPIQRNLTIESQVANKFRMYLYNCGWLNNNYNNILKKADIKEFYLFLVSNMLKYKLKITLFKQNINYTEEKTYNFINVNDKYINTFNKVINLTDIVNNWFNIEIYNNGYNCKFTNIPILLPIYINIRDNNTKKNNKYINIMESIQFNRLNDNVQKILTWNINSIICQDKDDNYYSVIYRDDKWIEYTDKKIPSNRIIDMEDINEVRNIVESMRFVFYYLQ
jgi:bifunctional DNase/RNase